MTTKSVLRWTWNRLLGRSSKPTTIPKDSFRESLETVVFVVVLVFMLKQFVVEAFVIPTGSMAETLYGTRRQVMCDQCKYVFQLNSDCEEPADSERKPRRLQGYCCPNCRFRAAFDQNQPPKNESGDRVLVLKPIYHREAAKPGDVVVFKYPEYPQTGFSAQNYIKRMWGTGGQTIAIYRGDLYVCENLKYPDELPPDVPAKDLWMSRYTFHNHETARKKFEESRLAGFPDTGDGFKLIRKEPRLIDEMKRIVYDNDFQAKSLTDRKVPNRWKPDAGWNSESGNMAFTHTGDSLTFVRYTNPIGDPWNPAASPNDTKPALIDNFLGYNGESVKLQNGTFAFVLDTMPPYDNWRFWVGDLIVQCEATIPGPDSQVVLELSKGPNQFQATFKDGKVTMTRTGPHGKELASAATPITKAGTYTLKFANVDCRLHVWVNGTLIKSDAPVDYAPTLPEAFDPDDKREEGWVTKHDKEAPVSIGATGGVRIAHLMIWRDTYYIREQWSQAHHYSSQADTYFVQPGHYLCLGDNSTHSKDSREWGTVPDRLLLGKAVFIFWPYDRIGRIR